MATIEDGKGKGRIAGVTPSNRLMTDVQSLVELAIRRRDAYTVWSDADSGAVTSDFFYMKNDSDRNLIINKIMLFSPTLDLEILVTTGVTGSPTSGTAVTPVNLYTGGSAADCTCEQRDGDMALTGGNTVDHLWTNKDFYGGQQQWDYPAGIILPPRIAMVLHTVIDPTADVDCTVHFYFEDVV